MAAAKQCGRAELPPVREAAQFRDAIRACKDKGLILAWEGMKGAVAAENLRLALREADQKRVASLDVHLFIGPEGGFSEEEIELAELWRSWCSAWARASCARRPPRPR
jgi:16S rRNA (uracil1498-N3)-methyltransferase